MGTKNGTVFVSAAVRRVVEAFLEQPGASRSGSDLHQCCGLASGTLYPILLRLEAAGWFVSQWETVDPTRAGGPRRRLYRLTSTGQREASDVLANLNRGVFA